MPSLRELTSEELAAVAQEFAATGREAETVAADLAPHQLRWRPAADRWSIADCLEHLVLAGEAYLEVFDAAIQGAWERGLVDGGRYRPGRVGRWIARLLEPPPGLAIPAPSVIRPRRRSGDAGDRGRGTDEEASSDPLGDFLELRSRLRERLVAADGLALGRVRLSSPFVPLLRFDLGSAFRIVAAHERRHLWQARQVREAEGFPVDPRGPS